MDGQLCHMIHVHVYEPLICYSACTYVYSLTASGPNVDMADVRLSGTVVDQTITSLPATVIFNITDDEVSVEVDETYPLTLMAADTTVLIEELMTTIVITDNVDSKCTRLRMQCGLL